MIARATLAAVLGTLALATAATAEAVSIRADQWCPYNCEPGSDRPGYMIEILQEALGPHGHTIDYQTMNWARSLASAEEGSIDGVVGASTDEAPGFHLGPVLGQWDLAVAVRKGESFDVGAADPFAGRSIGVIRGYDYGGAVADYVAANAADDRIVQVAGGEAPLETNLRKLEAGRVDLVPDDAAVLRYTIADLGLEGAFDLVSMEEPSPLYAAFSPRGARSADYAAMLAAAVDELRASGRLDEILARYGLTDWR